MSKGNKQWVKPGFMATKSAYERQRMQRINLVKEKMDTLGLKHMATSLMGSVQPKCTNKNGKRIMANEGDNDYRPSDGEEDSGDNSLDSLVHEVWEVPSERLHTFSSERLPTFSSGTVASHAEADSTPPVVGIQHTVPEISPTEIVTTSSSSRVGKLPVPIPPQFCVPVGSYANKFSSAVGIQVQEHLSDVIVRRWSNVPAASLAPIINRLGDHFDLQGDDKDVQKAVTTKCGRLLSVYTHKLYKKYKKLKEVKGEEYAKSHPPKNCKAEHWISLINVKWKDEKFLKRSTVNKSNRAKLKTNHTCGSKSLPVRVDIATQTNDGQLPDMLEFYHSTHYNVKKNKWAAPECEVTYEAIRKKQEEHCSQPNAIPLTTEELSIQVLGWKSGYVKGLGLRHSSSIKTTTACARDVEHVMHLESQIEMQRGEIETAQNELQTHQKKIDELTEANKRQTELTKKMFEFLQSQGFTLPFADGGSLF